MANIDTMDCLMDKHNHFTNQAKMLKALAHESRLMIVDRLSQRFDARPATLRDAS